MSEELKAKIKQTWEEAFNQGKVDGFSPIPSFTPLAPGGR
jgi:hypothetical protein